MKKLHFANLPTPIEEIQLVDADLPVRLFMKRDDFTGMGLSGNKIRKLEYLLYNAIENDVTDIITTGGIQSNHARATAMACAKLGLHAHLLLSGDEKAEKEGNNFLNHLAGADVRYASPHDYVSRSDELMEHWKKTLEEEGGKVMIIPLGASNALGSVGYVEAFEEIVDQEQKEERSFDLIVTTVGSGGTLSGLIYGNKLNNNPTHVMGITVSQPAEFFATKVIPPILEDLNELYGNDLKFNEEDIHILDGYQGLGYAKSKVEELEFIKDFTTQTGIILDPVYTGKAMYGLMNEILSGNLNQYENILFIHTGGTLGWTKEQIQMLNL